MLAPFSIFKGPLKFFEGHESFCSFSETYGITKIIFWKKFILKLISKQQKACKISQHAKLYGRKPTFLYTNNMLENHYSTAQSSRVGCSRRGHKLHHFGLLWSILWAIPLHLLIFTMIFSFGIITLGIVVHSGSIGAFKYKNQLSTSQYLSSQLEFMCPKCVHILMSALCKSLVMINGITE